MGDVCVVLRAQSVLQDLDLTLPVIQEAFGIVQANSPLPHEQQLPFYAAYLIADFSLLLVVQVHPLAALIAEHAFQTIHSVKQQTIYI